MAGMPVQRNNVIAGLFLVCSLLLAVTLSFVLSDAAERFGSFARYTIRFDVAEGVPGVKVGSPVTLGGLSVGRVTAVNTIFEELPDQTRLPIGLDVGIEVSEDVVLFSNARAYVLQPILGTMASINVADPGRPGAGPGGTIATRLTEDTPLNGDVAPALLAQAGLGPEESQLIRQMINDARGGAGVFRELAERLRPAVDTGVADVEETLERFRSISQRFDERSEVVTEDIVAIVDDLRAFADGLDPVMADVDAGVADARAAIASVQATIDENRPLILQSTENIEQITARVDAETLQRISEILDEGLLAASSFADAGARADGLLAESSPDIRRTIGNARQISDQGALFVQEVRAAPWRLLERPKTKEIREQLLYDATRNYAVAVSDLRSSSESLDGALASLGRAPEAGAALEPEVIVGLTGEVRRAFAAYREAEEALLDIVAAGRVPPGAGD